MQTYKTGVELQNQQQKQQQGERNDYRKELLNQMLLANNSDWRTLLGLGIGKLIRGAWDHRKNAADQKRIDEVNGTGTLQVTNAEASAGGDSPYYRILDFKTPLVNPPSGLEQYKTLPLEYGAGRTSPSVQTTQAATPNFGDYSLNSYNPYPDVINSAGRDLLGGIGQNAPSKPENVFTPDKYVMPLTRRY